MSPLRVFISYSRDSPRQEERVRQLADRLRGDGLEVLLDQDQERLEEPLTRWMERQLDEADFTLAVITEGYGRRRGSAFESHLMIQELFEAGMRNEKYVPVLFAEADARFIPRPLRGYRYFRVGTEEGYQQLLRHLAGQPAAGGAVPPETAPARRRRLSTSVRRITAAMGLLLLLAFLSLRLQSLRTLVPPPADPAAAAAVTVPAPVPAPLAAPPQAAPRKKKPAPAAPAAAGTPAVERVQATGTGFCGPQYSGAQRKALARRAAEVDGRRELAEVIAAHIRARTRVANNTLTNDDAQSSVDQVVRGARIVAERELPDGGYEVTLEAWVPR